MVVTPLPIDVELGEGDGEIAALPPFSLLWDEIPRQIERFAVNGHPPAFGSPPVTAGAHFLAILGIPSSRANALVMGLEAV